MPPTLSNTPSSSPIASCATPRSSAARMSSPARIAASAVGSTPIWLGRNCKLLSKVHAWRRNPSGLRGWADGGPKNGEAADPPRANRAKKPAALIEFGPPHSQSRGLVRGGALADGERWPIHKGHHRFVALAIWRPDKALAKTCADFSDLEIGPDGCLYLLSDKSSTIARLDDLPAGGGTATLLEAWQLGDLDGKPEGLAFTALGRAVVGLDTRKARRNLVLLDPAIAPLRGDGQREPEAKQSNGEAQGGSKPSDLPVQAQTK